MCRGESQVRRDMVAERAWRRQIRPTATYVFLSFVVGALGIRSSADAQSAAEPSVPEPEEVELRPTPPEVESRVDAVYPARAHAEGQEATVVLLVTIGADGSVGDVTVAESAGPLFDAAALTAMAQWRFKPARREGEAVVSRIRVPFFFRLPAAQEPSPQPTPQPVRAGTSPDEDSGSAGRRERIMEVTVRGERELRTEDRSASDFVLDREVIRAAPRMEGAEVLRSAPGLYLGRGEGPAVAHNYMLRGFDADHGQDIEFRVGGVPINLPSHLHGQGYADLGFLIADVVREVRITEGVYDPRQGDFAIAGSVDLSLGVEGADRGVRVRSSYGSFHTFRQLVLWAPSDVDGLSQGESFGAVQYGQTDGFGENRAAKSGSGIVQHRFGSGEITYRAIGIVHAARSDLAGVLRQDDIDAATVCFECVYPLATAKAQNALANRILVGLFMDYNGRKGANGQLGSWIGFDNFRLQRNFTGFIQTSRTLARVAGRGDLLELQNRTLSLGLTGRYRTARFRPASWAHGTVEVGVDGRADVIDQEQNLLDAAVRNQTWDRRVDASIRGLDLGFWGDLDWRFTKYLTARLGFRGDVLSYDVEDRLGNFAPLTRPRDAFLVGFRRSAFGLAVGPRASVQVQPVPWLAILAAYGEGYRSPQARTLEDGEDAPFSKVRSADVGVRLDGGDALSLSVSGYYTRLSDDAAFDAAEGRLERIGATRRLGAVAQVTTRPVDWLASTTSVTYVDATLLEPPPATADEPEPPFTEGQNLPFVPPIVLRTDVSAGRTLRQRLGGKPLGGRAGLGLSFLSSRPLPFGQFASPVALLDASAELTWGPVAVSLALFNALNARYAAVEYNFSSDWNPDDGVRPRVPARHIAAGAPRSWMLSLGVTL